MQCSSKRNRQRKGGKEEGRNRRKEGRIGIKG
jgi:hypothetical protein